MTGETVFHDQKPSFYFEGTDEVYRNAFINEEYEVLGYTFDQQDQSFVKFKELFASLEQANSYFDEMKKNHPLSKIKIYRNTWQQFRYYG